MGPSDFGQFKGTDSESRCYTGNLGGYQSLFRVLSLVFVFFIETSGKTV